MTATQLRNYTEAELKNLKAMVVVELGNKFLSQIGINGNSCKPRLSDAAIS